MKHGTSALGFFLLATTVLGTACVGTRGSGTEAVNDRETEGFDQINVGGAFDLDVTVGPETKVVVSGDDNIVPLISTEVRNGTLHIKSEESINPELDLRVEVQTPNLEGLDVSGACDVEIRGIRGDEFDLDLSGASDVVLLGETGTLKIDASGASDLSARDLKAQHVEIDLSGAGSVEVTATESIDADISGAASVDVWGSPGEVSQDVSGAGELELHGD